MSLYNMICGINPYTQALLKVLVLDEIPHGEYRLRDVYMPTPDTIGLVCRTGGGNRRQYNEIIIMFQNHPCYVDDADDDFDETFMTVYFRVPPHFEALACAIHGITDNTPPLEKFQKAVNDMKDGVDNESTQRMLQVGQEIVEQITSGESGEIANEDGAVMVENLTPEEVEKKMQEGWRPMLVDKDDVSTLRDMGYEVNPEED